VFNGLDGSGVAFRFDFSAYFRSASATTTATTDYHSPYRILWRGLFMVLITPRTYYAYARMAGAPVPRHFLLAFAGFCCVLPCFTLAC